MNFPCARNHNEPCKVLNVALAEKVREMKLFLNGEKYPEVLKRFVQPEYSEVGQQRRVSFFSQQEMMEKIVELKAVTGRWPMPNDVEDEEDFPRHGGFANLTYAELVELNHELLVTGRRSPNGHFGAADITTTSHWISNSSTRTRTFSKNSTRLSFSRAAKQEVKEEDKQEDDVSLEGRSTDSLHTRVGHNQVPYILSHHATYGLFVSRSSLLLVIRPRDENLGTSVTDGLSLLHTSHLCNVGACLRPDHLVLETSKLNRSRNPCFHMKVCTDDAHMIANCIITDVDIILIRRLVFNKRATVTDAERIKFIAENSNLADDVIGEDCQKLLKLLFNKKSRLALSIYRAGIAFTDVKIKELYDI